MPTTTYAAIDVCRKLIEQQPEAALGVFPDDGEIATFNPGTGTSYRCTALGLLNAFLDRMGHPRVAVCFNDGQPVDAKIWDPDA